MSEREWTDEEALAHGRRWVAAGWTWATGQVVITKEDGETGSAVVDDVRDGRPFTYRFDLGDGRFWSSFGRLMEIEAPAPDLRDDGTRGHALGQVRERVSDPDAFAGTSPSELGEDRKWFLCSCRWTPPIYRPTESEVLLAGMEALQP